MGSFVNKRKLKKVTKNGSKLGSVYNEFTLIGFY